MASVWINERTLPSGAARYDVKFEGPPVRMVDGTSRGQIHVGTFKTRREAERRARWARDEWSAGRSPDPRRILLEQTPNRSRMMRAVVDDWLSTLVDLVEATRQNYKARADRIVMMLPGDVAAVTPADVRVVIGDLVDAEYKPGTIGQFVTVLRMILDHAEVDPNPARHRSVKIPAMGEPRMRVPSEVELAAIRDALHQERYKLLLDFLEDTGVRISEAARLDWRDVSADAVLIHGAKGRGGKLKLRSVTEDLHPIRLLRVERGSGSVFGATAPGFRNAMWTACERAGVPYYSPHDVRHLHASRLMRADSRNLAVIAGRLGHSQKVLLGTYSHPLPPG